MAWTTTQLVRLYDGSTDYYFAPSELVLKTGRTASGPNFAGRQVRQESESGQVKVITTSANLILTFEYAINRMPYSDRSVGGTTVRGLSTLITLIKSTFVFSENTMRLWGAGETKVGAGTFVRFWSSNFDVDALRMLPTEVYGNGSQTILLRKDV